MLYEKIKSYIDPISLQKRKTTSELLKVDKEEFRDILALYIKLVWLLKSKWIVKLNTPAIKLDDKWRKIHREFLSRDFDYLILSKGNNVMNDLILESTIKKCAIMVEEYIESKLLLKDPQLEYFAQFNINNMEWMEFVFDRNIFNEDVLCVYQDSEGNDIEVTDKMHYNTMKKEDIELLSASLKASDKIKALLLRLSAWHFTVYKKYVVIAAEELHKWNDLEDDWGFLLNINKEINKIKT